MSREPTGATCRTRPSLAAERQPARPAAWVLAAAAAFCVLFASPCLADGLAFQLDDLSRFEPIREHGQIAAIHHHDGIQKMILAVNLGKTDEREALWIFPVRGRPEAIRFDLLDEFPFFAGEDLLGSARKAAGDAVAALAWTLTPCCCMMSFTEYKDEGAVAAELTRWGLTAELIHGAGVEALRRHFEGKGIRLREGAFKAFSPYLDGAHSLVAVRISSRRQFLDRFPEQKDKVRSMAERWPCVYVEFPSDDVFYPVKPTGFFGDVVPMRLYVLGYVDLRPDGRPPFEGENRKVEFFRQARSTLTEHERFFEGCEEGRFSYTTISFEHRGGRYAEDLSLRTHRPLRFRYAEGLHALRLDSEERPEPWFAAAAACALLLQLLCMLLAGKILTGRWRIVYGWAILGIAVFAAGFGTYWALCVSSRAEPPGMAKLRENGWLRPKYVLLSSALFVFLLFVLHEVAVFPLRLP